MTLDNANRWLTRFAVQQIVLQAMEDMHLDAMIMPDRQYPAVHPRPAARADAQRTRRRRSGAFSARRAFRNSACRGVDDPGLRPRARRVGARRHASAGSDSREASAVGDVLRASVQRADALQDRVGVRERDAPSRAAGGLWPVEELAGGRDRQDGAQPFLPFLPVSHHRSISFTAITSPTAMTMRRTARRPRRCARPAPPTPPAIAPIAITTTSGQ